MCQTTERAELFLPMTDAAPGAARAFARAHGCSDHAAQLLDDALLLITELVTNSVQYGQPPLAIAIECEDGGLTVRVRDGDRRPPHPRQASPDDESGRGLTLLDRLSHAWGVASVVDEHGSGKAVWFELRAPDAAEAAAH
jgi:anti-sigma regulatory factor (Ser/Thr protein kinase)